MKTLLQSILLIGLVTLSLSTTCLENQANQQAQLTGKWKWVESSFQTRGMAEPEITTPESTGINMHLEFTGAKQVKVFHNKTEVQNLSYSLTKDESGTRYITIENVDESISPNIAPHGILRIKDNQLEILGGYNDAGANQTYSKIR